MPHFSVRSTHPQAPVAPACGVDGITVTLAKLRLHRDANAGATADVTLATSARYAAGVRLPVDLKVVEGQALPLVLDMDACAALVPRGAGYVFMPRPRALPGRPASASTTVCGPGAANAGSRTRSATR